MASCVDEHLERADWRVNANARQGYSPGGLTLNISGNVRCQNKPGSVKQLSYIRKSQRPVSDRFSFEDRSTVSIFGFSILEVGAELARWRCGSYRWQ